MFITLATQSMMYRYFEMKKNLMWLRKSLKCVFINGIYSKIVFALEISRNLTTTTAWTSTSWTSRWTPWRQPSKISSSNGCRLFSDQTICQTLNPYQVIFSHKFHICTYNISNFCYEFRFYRFYYNDNSLAFFYCIWITLSFFVFSDQWPKYQDARAWEIAQTPT